MANSKKGKENCGASPINFQKHRALADPTIAPDAETNRLSRHFSPGKLKSSAPKGDSSNLGKSHHVGRFRECKGLTVLTVLSISRFENVGALAFADTLGNKNTWQDALGKEQQQVTTASSAHARKARVI